MHETESVARMVCPLILSVHWCVCMRACVLIKTGNTKGMYVYYCMCEKGIMLGMI